MKANHKKRCIAKVDRVPQPGAPLADCKAADQGHAHAQHKLGLMFSEGRGVAQTDVEATRWYRKAAD